MRAHLHKGGRESALAPLVLPHGQQHGQRLALRPHEQRRARPREQRLRGLALLIREIAWHLSMQAVTCTI